jgi:hypothetical protein
VSTTSPRHATAFTPRRLAGHPGLPWLALAILCSAAFALAMRAGAGTTFFGDEWSFLLKRQGWSLGTFFEPHSEHPVVVPVAIYKLVIAVFGMDSYTPFRAAVALMHVATGAVIYLYARPRLGAWLGLAPAALLLFLGTGWENIVWPFQTTFIGSVLFGIAALVALDARRDKLACGLLLLSVMSSAIGLPFLIIVAIEVAWDPRRLRRWWIPAIPAVVFAFIVGVLGDSDHHRAPASHAVRFALEMATAGFSAFGTGPGWGQALLVAGVAVLTLAARRRALPDPRLAALIVGTAAFWLVTASGRADIPGVPPETSRYAYVSAALLLVMFSTGLRGPVISRTAGAAIAAATVLLCVSNAGLMKEGGTTRLGNTSNLLPELSALELARDRAAPDQQIDVTWAPDIRAGLYLKAIDAHGSPAPSAESLRHAPDNERQAFDGALMRTDALALKPAPASEHGSGASPLVDLATNGSVSRSGACQVFRPTAAQAAFDVTAPAGTYVVSADEGAVVPLFLRRLADSFTGMPTLQLTGGTTATLTLPPDRLPGPWHLRAAPGQTIRICGTA